MVKVKIKTNKKRVYEASLPLSSHTVELGAKLKSPEERRRELNGLWGRLMKQKDIDIRKLYGKTMENSGYRIPLAKMNVPVNVEVTDIITGETHVEELIPAEIAAFCEMAIANAMSQQHLGTILQRFTKPIIWTFKIDTAASDGVRIAVNPIFAQELLYQGKKEVKDALASGRRMSGDERTIRVARLFLFVLVHEAYHQIYRHREQAELKSETQGGSNHLLSNIAMDAEINRDIEKQIPQWFAGATAEINGMFDTRFRMEPWQDIFDAYFYKKLEPPQQTNPNPINRNNSSQPQSDGNDDSSSSSSNQNQKNNQKQNQGSQGGDSSDQNGSQNQQGNNTQGKQGDQQDDSDMQQSYNPYDDTDLSKADSDTMTEYDDDLKVPDISDKSKEYQDAYEDELRKELDKALGRNSQNSDESDKNNDSGKDGDNTNHMSNSNGNNGDKSDESEEQDDNGMSTSGSGKPDMHTDQEMNGNGSDDFSGDEGDDDQSNSNMQGNSSNNQSNSNMQNDNGDDSDSMSNGNQMSNSNSNSNMSMSAEERAAREQARKDIRNAIQTLKDMIDAEMSEEPDIEEQQKQLEGKVFETEISSTFGGADMLSQEEMAELAAEAGNPYTSQELTADVDELNKQFNEKYANALKAISSDLQVKLEDIADKLKAKVALANWKQKLKSHFRDAMKGSVEQVRSKRAMSQKWRDDRYNPYKEREFKEQNGANVFYLIDASGSMYTNGNDIFLQIFKDIITIEKTCNVDMSCRAFFCDAVITPKDCAIWNHRTNKNKVLDILTTMSSPGGTDITSNVIAVTKLKPPYYFNNGEKHTLIMVFTDGEDYGWNVLKQIPSRIKKDIVFVILNTKKLIMQIIPMIMKQGIPLKNILGINISEYK